MRDRLHPAPSAPSLPQARTVSGPKHRGCAVPRDHSWGHACLLGEALSPTPPVPSSCPHPRARARWLPGVTVASGGTLRSAVLDSGNLRHQEATHSANSSSLPPRPGSCDQERCRWGTCGQHTRKAFSVLPDLIQGLLAVARRWRAWPGALSLACPGNFLHLSQGPEALWKGQ